MKAIFLCQQTDKIWKIYNDETIGSLQRIVDIEKMIYSKQELLSSPESFSDVEIVFSTWECRR